MIVKLANYPEPHMVAVGVPPEALGNLWIRPEPGIMIRLAPGRYPQFSGIAQERSSPDHVLISAGNHNRIYNRPGILRICVFNINILAEFGNISKHILQPEWIGADRPGQL